jgi:hypothetical protein
VYAWRFAAGYCIGQTPRVGDVVRLAVVGSQGEADVICSLLRAHAIQCGDREVGAVLGRGGGWGGWREVFVSEDDLETARDLLAAQPETLPEDDEGAG